MTCDYGHYQEIRSNYVITRKAHTCASCDKPFPAGTTMRVSVGRFEGDFTFGHTCKTCEFMAREEEGTPFHACHGWGMDAGHYEQEIWAYVHSCLTNNGTPTKSGLKSHLEQTRALEEA